MLRSLRTLLLLSAILALVPAQDTSASLSGEARDSAGAGIPALHVELRLAEPPRTIFSLQTDTEGKFEFTLLPAGTYMLVLAKPGFRTLMLKSIPVASGEQRMLPALRLEGAGSCGSGPPELEQLQLLPGAAQVGNLSGRVVQGEDRPSIGATVKLLCDGRKVCGETKTNSNGQFIFFNLPPRGDMTIRVTHSGFYPAEGAGYEVRSGFDSTYRPIVLDPKLRTKRPLIVCE